MSISLLDKITIIQDSPIINSKASESYVSVRFDYALLYGKAMFRQSIEEREHQLTLTIKKSCTHI